MSKEPLRFALMGHPISHSLSPRIHNAAFQALGMNAVYELRDSSAGTEATVRALVDEGYAGWNVTMPDKLAVGALCDELTREAALSGSVNTVLNRDGRLIGTSTDGRGFLDAASGLGIKLKGRRLTLLGGGGAAVSILIAAALDGADQIDVFCRSARSRERMQAVSGKLRGISSARIVLCPFEDTDALRRSIASSALLANATNVGMGESADQSPVPASLLVPDTAVFDAVYHPLKTRLLIDAEKAGCPTANGLPMLIGQAAASFEFWTGRPMPLKSLPSLP